MKFIDEYRNQELGKKLIDRIHRHSTRPVSLMEFCGGHTVAVFKHGLRQLMPPTIKMLSGPGCPVCVTASADLNQAIAMAQLPGVIITTFGDLLRVPGSSSSLQLARAEGCDVRVVYSAQDALQIARENPAKSAIFLGIGFETTAPTIAASVLQAEREEINNYYVLPLHKLTPPVMKAILDMGEVRLDGIICPGHVSTIIGSHPYRFIPDNYQVACVVSGFEPLDILLSVDMLVSQIEAGTPRVEIAYRRGVKPEGNQPALTIMNTVFEITEANWRGIGIVPSSGLKLKETYRRYDAASHFPVSPEPGAEPEGCICGSILRGVSTPLECRLFGRTCTPEHPVGPCMVSSEGSCATYHQYGADYEG